MFTKRTAVFAVGIALAAAALAKEKAPPQPGKRAETTKRTASHPKPKAPAVRRFET